MSAASTSIDAPKANANAIASSSDASGRQQVQRYGKKLLEILKVHAKVKREIKDRRNALDNPDDRIVHQYERNFKPVYDLLVLERDLLEKAQESGMELLRWHAKVVTGHFLPEEIHLMIVEELCLHFYSSFRL